MEVEELLSDVRSGPVTPASSRSRGSIPVSSSSGHNEDVRQAVGMSSIASHCYRKIKCFLTGVKGFQYKQEELHTGFEVYVDDGSLISEILIDHALVQKKIGFSPLEVTGALTSSDRKRVNDMRETLKCFQKFLINFEVDSFSGELQNHVEQGDYMTLLNSESCCMKMTPSVAMA
ncbi:hypothetical protein HAX54_034392 [Datura stramonium]|uniref:RecQ-mediated genome instability protein 1 C-terminal OB-fold domain-containing protein n=1 Tax=Datura stramonium TaxID=4076 RepID=A0ABS8SE74_DATST|nr:hypothetical protein [Datura stramonium]